MYVKIFSKRKKKTHERDNFTEIREPFTIIFSLKPKRIKLGQVCVWCSFFHYFEIE